MHILWVNDNAGYAGGAERYIADVVPGIRELGARCTLLYDPLRPVERAFTARFDAAFPLVVPDRQVADIQPDAVFVHNLADSKVLPLLRHNGAATARYLHDHNLLCLRDKKYTTLRRRTCTRKAEAAACYPCLGFVSRSRRWPGIRLRSIRSLRREQKLNQSLDAIVVGSRYMRDHVVAHGFDERRVRVFPPIVEDPQLSQPVTRDPSLLLFVGTLVRGKGLDILLHAMAKVPESLRLVVAGEGKQADWLHALTARLGLTGRVEYTGRLDGDQLDRAYRRAACVVIPSRAPETFSRVGPEALLRGTPVIASDVGGTGEWLRDGETGMAVPPNDPRALADAIVAMTGNADRARQLTEHGRTICRNAYASENHIEALMRFLESLAFKRGAR